MLNKDVDIDVSVDYIKAICTANDLLIEKKFDECLNLSQKALTGARSFPEKKSSGPAVEGLCILCIQALAELNRWQEVLPLVTHVFNGIEDCPEKVVQICVLLHAQVRDFTTCAAITHIWLRNSRNLVLPQYHLVVEMFLLHVLVPQRKWAEITHFLQSSPGLSEERRSAYCQHAIKLEEAVHQAEQPQREEENKLEQSAETASTGQKSLSDHAEQQAENFGKRLFLFLRKYIYLPSPYMVMKLAVWGVCMYLLATRANFLNAHDNQQRVLVLWAALVRLWRSMFAPYHVAKSAS